MKQLEIQAAFDNDPDKLIQGVRLPKGQDPRLEGEGNKCSNWFEKHVRLAVRTKERTGGNREPSPVPLNEIFNNDSANNIPIDSDVEFHIPEGNIMDKWTFTSSDGRFEMEFVPVLDRAACIDFKMLVSDQHQVFGRMSGKAVLDDGTVIEVKDMMCFAEKVHNRY